VGLEVVDLVLESAPATDAVEADDRQRCETRDDDEELEHLGVDRGGQAAEGDVAEHDRGGDEQRDPQRPAEQGVDHLGQQNEVHTGDEQLGDREGQRVHQVCAGTETTAHELRHRSDLRAVVEGHHDDAEEDHRRDGADPEVVHRLHAVLDAVGGHADDLDGSEVRGDEGEAGDPGGQSAAGEEEVDGAGHPPLRSPADAEDEGEEECDQRVIDPAGVKPQGG